MLSTPRRCTLMTTSRPSRVVARCTEAIEAVASGVSSMRAKRDEGSSTWNSSCRVACVVAQRSGGTASCSTRSSSIHASGMMSARVERNWPTLIHSPWNSSMCRQMSADILLCTSSHTSSDASAGLPAASRALVFASAFLYCRRT